MAEKNSTKPAAGKPRRAARTLEEQIAELQAKAAARKDKLDAKAKAQLELVEGQLVKARARVDQLVDARAELIAELGIDEDQAPESEPAVDETSQEG